MILVMCMAGLNTRFHNVGFDVPKYLLPWDGSFVIDSVLEELGAAKNFERIILLPNQRDKFFEGNLLDAVARHGITQQDVVFIPDTRGQAHTAAIGAQIALDRSGSENSPIAYHNADTILCQRDWPTVIGEFKTRDVFIDVFPASSPAFSYVAVNGNKVSHIKEKQVISPFASSGFYAFKTPGYYLDTFNTLLADGTLGQREMYISDVIQRMIEDGADIFINELNRNSTTLVLGTPEEYGLELARRALSR